MGAERGCPPLLLSTLPFETDSHLSMNTELNNWLDGLASELQGLTYTSDRLYPIYCRLPANQLLMLGL